MSSHLTEAGEITRRFDLAEHAQHAEHHRASLTQPGPRRRDQLAASLRRVADHLDQ